MADLVDPSTHAVQCEEHRCAIMNPEGRPQADSGPVAALRHLPAHLLGQRDGPRPLCLPASARALRTASPQKSHLEQVAGMNEFEIQGQAGRATGSEHEVSFLIRGSLPCQPHLGHLRGGLAEEQGLVSDGTRGEAGVGYRGGQGGGDRRRDPDQTEGADAHLVTKETYVALSGREDLKAQRVSRSDLGRSRQRYGRVSIVDAGFEATTQLHAGAVVVEVGQQLEALAYARLAHGVERLLEHKPHGATLCKPDPAAIVGQPHHVRVGGGGAVEDRPVVSVVVSRHRGPGCHGDRPGVVRQPEEGEGSGRGVVQLQALRALVAVLAGAPQG